MMDGIEWVSCKYCHQCYPCDSCHNEYNLHRHNNAWDYDLCEIKCNECENYVLSYSHTKCGNNLRDCTCLVNLNLKKKLKLNKH